MERIAVSTEVSTTLSPTYTRSTPAMEMTRLPWITTPEFSTWSSTSSSEMSSSVRGEAAETSSCGSAGICAHERIRRPGAGGLDAPLVPPTARKLGEDIIPFLAVGAANEERCLPFEVALSAGDLSSRHGIDRDLRQSFPQVVHFLRCLRRRGRLEHGRLLLEVVAATLRSHSSVHRFPDRKNLH